MAQDLKINIIARDKSKQALKGLQGSLGKLRSSVFNLRNAFIGLGAGLVIRNIVNTGKQIENLQVQLKFLFGSAQEGAKAFDEMAKFASKVPFSLEEIQAGSGVLAVVSDDAKELANLMKITGNVAAVTGLDFKTTAEQIQRSLSAGISAADLFRDKGVKDMLGFSAGAKVSVEETIAAFEKVFGEGGRFDGATDELANTLSGTLSMIGDKVFNFKRVLLDAGFFSELKKQFGDLNKFIEANSEEFDAIAKAIGTILTVAVKGLAMAIKGVGTVVGFLRDSYEDLILTMNKLPLVNIKIITKAQREILNNQAKMQKNQLSSLLTKNKINDATKAGNKELEKEKKIIFNIFESHRKLEDAVKKTNAFHKDSKTVMEKTLVLIKEQNNEWNLSNEIFGFINQAVSRFSTSIAETIVLGKKLNASFKELAQSLLVEIIAKTIERIILMGIEKVLSETLFKKEADKENMIRKQNTNLKRQIALQATLATIGGGGIPFFASGGSVSKGKPVVVGERGAELFVPNSTGQIQQNARGTGGGSVNVNFNIDAIDSSSFNSVLVENRGVITSIINNALNEKGRRELV